MKIKILFILVIILLSATFRHTAFAQGTTAFTYQGQLKDNGTNANGTYTMVFKLYDAITVGNLVGSPSSITNNVTLANGLFTVSLDFGAGAFTGGARWLDITIANGGVTQTLAPRVPVLPTPYAQFAAVAASVTNGAIMNAQIANNAVANQNLTANAVNATNIASGQVVKTLNGLADSVILAAGANVTLATNGNLLQISAAGGVTGASLTPGNNVGFFTNSGIVQISSFVPHIVVFVGSGGTNGTFVVPTNVTRIEVEMWGAGGGGGTGNTNGYDGGGGGGSSYSLGVFTVTAGSSYSFNVPASANGGQNGAATTFSGPSISMSAGGGFAGANASNSSNGAGGSGGTASGGNVLNVQGTGGDNDANGGGVFRGGGISLGHVQTGGGGGLGPGGGGTGGGAGNGITAQTGNPGNTGAIFITY